MTYDATADVPILSTTACDLKRSGFTEAQAMALALAVEASASGAVDRLGRELARWHVYLAMYLLIQLGIVLLGVLMIQATRDPVLPPRAGLVSPSAESLGGDASGGSAAWVVAATRLAAGARIVASDRSPRPAPATSRPPSGLDTGRSHP